MNALAGRFAPDDRGATFVYTHEADPGVNCPHLSSFEKKRRHALPPRDVAGVMRPIQPDALDGECHHLYRLTPSTTWGFNRSGVTVYRSDGSDHFSVHALEYFVHVAERRRAGARLAPVGVDHNGPKAAAEFRAAFGP